MRKFQRKGFIVSVLLIVFLLIAVCIGYQHAQTTNNKMRAEIIFYYPESGSALATSGEKGGLFQFSFPKTPSDIATGADLTQCGMVLELTGNGVFQYTYPMGYPDVKSIKFIEQRDNFVLRYYGSLLETLVDADMDSIVATVDKLPNLNDGEKEGLAYLLACELQVY